jgi:hypothetical protein
MRAREAYDALIDGAKRSEYDRALAFIRRRAPSPVRVAKAEAVVAEEKEVEIGRAGSAATFLLFLAFMLFIR